MIKRLLVIAIIGLAGCKLQSVVDPNTGQAEKKYVLDSVVADKVETGAEALVATGTLASSFLPWLIPFVTAGGAGLATWRKIRPKLERVTKDRDAFYRGGEALAAALEDIKTNQPDIWAKVGPVIAEATKVVTDTENVIRGFRNLPPKT